jgi:hypothetical protein
MTATSEKGLNLFLDIEDGVIVGIRARCHELHGTDSDKARFLTKRVRRDFEKAKSFAVPASTYVVDANTGTVTPGRIRYQTFLDLGGLNSPIFGEIYAHYDVPQYPFVVVTPVVDGRLVTGGIGILAVEGLGVAVSDN